MSAHVSYMPAVSATTISQVADISNAAAVLGRGGYATGVTITAADKDFISGCHAALPNEPLFSQLLGLIDSQGTFSLHWSTS